MENVRHLANVNLEFIGQVSYYLAMGIQVCTAIVLGGAVGFEREIRMKSAGVKTNILICLGACVFTAISLINYSSLNSSNDPNRVVAQIVSGIGFLGAGAIIQNKGGVTGLTSAATMWVVAAIGVTVGLGYPVSAFIFTFTVLFVLRIVDPMLKKIQPHVFVHISVEIKSELAAIIEDVLVAHGAVILKLESIKGDGLKNEVQCDIKITKSALMKVLFQLRLMKSVKNIHHRDSHGHIVVAA